MNNTIEYYNSHAQEFISATLHADMSDARNRFLACVKYGGRILDAGCGSGRDALAFLLAGYQVDAFDASTELCKRATELLGFEVKCRRFEELTGRPTYDGIWACASLLHVRSSDLPDVVQRLKGLLLPDGVLYASFKEGDSERAKDGRFFRDMTEQSCRALFERAGFSVLESYISIDVRESRSSETWVNIICRVDR